MGRIVCPCAEAEAEVILLEFEGIGHAKIGERPTAVTKLQIAGAVLQPNAQVASRFTQDFVGVVLATVRDRGVFLPLDGGEAADPGNDTAELIGQLPGCVERANATGGESGDGAAVGVLAEVVLCGDVAKNLVAQKARVAVTHRVVQCAAHGILESSLPFLGIRFH